MSAVAGSYVRLLNGYFSRPDFFAADVEKGTIRTQSVLLSGGAWSSLFCRRHGIELPIGLVNATACRTTPGPEITSQIAVSGALIGLYFLSIAIAYLLRPRDKSKDDAKKA